MLAVPVRAMVFCYVPYISINALPDLETYYCFSWQLIWRAILRSKGMQEEGRVDL